MELIQEQTSIVVLGSWNPAILSPNWLATHALGHPAEAEIPVEIEVNPVGFLTPRFSLDGLKFLPGKERLTVHPIVVDEESLRKVEQAVKRVLESLLHTPVRGMGMNFEFRKTELSENELNFFDMINSDLVEFPKPYNLKDTRIVSALEMDDIILNLSRSYNNRELRLGFNFHYQTTSAAAASEYLSDQGSAFYENFKRANEIIAALFPTPSN